MKQRDLVKMLERADNKEVGIEIIRIYLKAIREI